MSLLFNQIKIPRENGWMNNLKQLLLFPEQGLANTGHTLGFMESFCGSGLYNAEAATGIWKWMTMVIPIKFYLKNQAVDQIWTAGHDVPRFQNLKCFICEMIITHLSHRRTDELLKQTLYCRLSTALDCSYPFIVPFYYTIVATLLLIDTILDKSSLSKFKQSHGIVRAKLRSTQFLSQCSRFSNHWSSQQ